MDKQDYTCSNSFFCRSSSSSLRLSSASCIFLFLKYNIKITNPCQGYSIGRCTFQKSTLYIVINVMIKKLTSCTEYSSSFMKQQFCTNTYVAAMASLILRQVKVCHYSHKTDLSIKIVLCNWHQDYLSTLT